MVCAGACLPVDLQSSIEPGREEIAWSDVAAVLTLGKFCGQASELGIAENWHARTAPEDLCGIPVGSVNDDRLYRTLDKVDAHKDQLCEHLMQRYIVGTPKSQLRAFKTPLARKVSRRQPSSLKPLQPSALWMASFPSNAANALSTCACVPS